MSVIAILANQQSEDRKHKQDSCGWQGWIHAAILLGPKRY